jgi:hypothetical protein
MRADAKTPLERYLAELAHRLSGPGTTRRRLLAEIDDHLREAVADGERRGLARRYAEQEAVRRLGPAAVVVARLAPMLAAAALRRAALALLAGIVLVVPVAYGLSENLLPPATWPTDAPPAELRWKVEAAFVLLLVAALAGLGVFIAARAGRLGLALASAGAAAGVLLTAAVLWTTLAVEWAQRVPGAGGAFAAAGAAALALLAPAAVLAGEAVAPLRRTGAR